jgi:hypothetical protein
MGVRFPSVASNTFVGPLPANATETVILTTPPINEPVDNAQVILLWFTSITAGTSTTSFQFKIRRGTTITGPVILAGTCFVTVVAAQNYISSGCYFDLPGIVAGQQYSLTIIQGAATVAGTFLDGALMALVL